MKSKESEKENFINLAFKIMITLAVIKLDTYERTKTLIFMNECQQKKYFRWTSSDVM